MPIVRRIFNARLPENIIVQTRSTGTHGLIRRGKDYDLLTDLYFIVRHKPREKKKKKNVKNT